MGIGAAFDVIKAGGDPDEGIARVDGDDVRYHLADAGPDEVVVADGGSQLLLAQDSALELEFAGCLPGFKALLRDERVDRNRQVVDAMLDEPFVFKAELDLGHFLGGVVSQGIDSAIKIELDALFGFAGPEEPECRRAQGKHRSDAAGYLDPAFKRFEENSTNMLSPPPGSSLSLNSFAEPPHTFRSA